MAPAFPTSELPTTSVRSVASSWITDSVGRVLGDRYYLGRPVGSGASAHVFVAEDKVLGRRVAVKVLRPGLAGDVVFLRRFQAEARVVAALRHPHILRIYDWGEDGGDPYLVSELLEGGSLRSLLDHGGRLSPSQAATVGYEAASALEHAHQRGLVHRDVKPANLLFDDNGRVSVADFGLARALAETAWTEPEGAILGTARYGAPEQMEGRPLGPPADVYALALVLAEATTGVVPFGTDTTLGTLMARVGRRLEIGEAAGPLAAVLRDAGAPEPGDRPDAGELAKQLRRLVAALPAPEPLPLAAPVDVGSGADHDPTRTGYPPSPPDTAPTANAGATSAATGSAGASLRPAPQLGERPEAVPAGLPVVVTAGAGATALEVSSQLTTAARTQAPAGGPAIGPAAGERGGAARGGRRRGPVLAAALVVAVLAAGGGAASWMLTRGPSLEPVPRLGGDGLGTARVALAAHHLHLVVAGRAYSAGVPSGEVVSQTPSRGRARRGDSVAVIVSRGPQPVEIPPLAGLSQAEAAKLLEADGLGIGKVARRSSLGVAAGSVIATVPASGHEPPGTRVGLVVSTGLPQVSVPLLHWPADSSWTSAAAALTAAHLRPVEERVYSNVVPSGEVVYTSPPPGAKVRWGSEVTVEVSRGPHPVTIPEGIGGQGVGAATSELGALGLGVSGVSGDPAAPVTGTEPPLGSAVRVGSSVQLVTG